MKASLVNHCYTNRLEIKTNNVKFKYLGATIQSLNLELYSSPFDIKMYCSISTDKYISNWVDNDSFNGFYQTLLEILEEAAAPESVINLVKLHRQNNEPKRN